MRARIMGTRLVARLGLGENAMLLPLAVLVGLLTAAAAVGFHELILFIRDTLYRGAGTEYLYGQGIWLLVAVPTLGGLVVGVIGRLVSQEREGHGVVDVMESVARTRGFVKARTAIEKIVTSAVTIGTGGSAGAEGPIVQIGAAVSGGVAHVFRLSRHQMPVLVGCGCAAGISAIFNAPLGGLLFTLEVILHDFRARAITPLVVSAVIANVTMRGLVGWLYEHGHGDNAYITVFADPNVQFVGTSLLDWPQVPAYALLGLTCGLLGAALARSMEVGEEAFRTLVTGRPWVKAMRPAVGGLLLGLLGLSAVLVAPEAMGGRGGPFNFEEYPMPAFYGDGYGVIETLLRPSSEFFDRFGPLTLLGLLVGLALTKLVATVLTLGSGGSGGIIAPSLFLGAVVGGIVGVTLREIGWFGNAIPEAYALVGMAALLAAVVHAPLASLLIIFEITGDAGRNNAILLPALLAVVVAMGASRLIMRDSIYDAALRRRGVRIGGADPALLSRLTIETVTLDPAATIGVDEPFDRVVELMDRWGTRDFAVVDRDGAYVGLLAEEDVNLALMSREAMPLVVVGELMRGDVPLVASSDDLQRAFDLFARLDVSHLPVGLTREASTRVIGLVSRAGLMRRYQQELDG